MGPRPGAEPPGGYTASREVDSSGSVSLYNRNRYVAAALKGRRVYITLDPDTVEWVVAGQARGLLPAACRPRS